MSIIWIKSYTIISLTVSDLNINMSFQTVIYRLNFSFDLKSIFFPTWLSIIMHHTLHGSDWDYIYVNDQSTRLFMCMSPAYTALWAPPAHSLFSSTHL